MSYHYITQKHDSNFWTAIHNVFILHKTSAEVASLNRLCYWQGFDVTSAACVAVSNLLFVLSVAR